jgi:hypothetical protein
LFLGTSGAPKDLDNYEITFKFSASPNVTDFCADWPVGVKPLAPIAKKGWELATVRTAPTADAVAKTLIMKPVGVIVQQVYKTGNLSLLGI